MFKPTLLFASLVLFSNVEAVTYSISTNADSGVGSLRAALADMATRPTEDHTINMQISNQTISLLSPLPNIRGRNVTFFGNTGLVIDGGVQHPIFVVSTQLPRTEQLRVLNMTLTRGVGPSGGCIRDQRDSNSSTILIVDSVSFLDCSATNNSNQAARGGAIYAIPILDVRNSRFIGNGAAPSATDTLGSAGGAISSFSALRVSNSQFLSNTVGVANNTLFALHAAVDASSSSQVSIDRSHFQGNQVLSPSQGAQYGVVGCGSTCFVSRSSFVGNSSNSLTSSGVLEVSNTSFANNFDTSIYFFGGNNSLRIKNSSFLRTVGPALQQAAHIGIQQLSGEGSPSVQVSNTLFGATNSGRGCSSGSTFAPTGVANFSVTADCNIFSTSSANAAELAMGAPIATINQNFVIPIASNSRAIDAGNPAPVGQAWDLCDTLDARNLSRPQDGNADGTNICDVGAYEVQLDQFFRNGFEN
jgi:hypothetical protein